MTDVDYMRLALSLAEKGRGGVRDGALVGAVAVREGQVIGEGYYPESGKPHAEVYALEGMADGTLKDRMEATMGDFVSKKTGKSEISYATCLGKRGFTIDDINVYLQDKFGDEFQIPDDPFYTSFSVNKLRKLKLPPKYTPPAT